MTENLKQFSRRSILFRQVVYNKLLFQQQTPYPQIFEMQSSLPMYVKQTAQNFAL